MTKYITLGLLAHVDAGKTTFAEQLLYHARRLRRPGRVDHRDTFFDIHPLEKQRGITIWAEQALFSYAGKQFTLIDTPGHIDFGPEMERAVRVMDYAVIIVSAVEGLQSHTETVWRLLRRHAVPTFFFINKVDRVGADAALVLREIEKSLTGGLWDLGRTRLGAMSEDLVETLALQDDDLLDQYLEHGYDEALWWSRLRQSIRECRLFPYGVGSALRDEGVEPFLELIGELCVSSYDPAAALSGSVYKVRHDSNGTRVTFLKITGGKLRAKEELLYRTGRTEGEEEWEREKVNELRLYHGRRYTIAEQAEAGELVAVTGLAALEAGMGFGTNMEYPSFHLVPSLRVQVLPDSAARVQETLRACRFLEAEEPTLRVTWDEDTQRVHVEMMGLMQREVLQESLRDRFGLAVSFGDYQVVYKESIEGKAVGYGHFEPLGHYAEVHLQIESAPPGSGISFTSACSWEELASGYQQMVKHAVLSQTPRGVLTGSALTDLQITLLKGLVHPTATKSSDFIEATWRALRQGLSKSSVILLEPYYAFYMEMAEDYISKVLHDIRKNHGTFETPILTGGRAILRGEVPVAAFMSYSAEFLQLTRGKGVIRLTQAGYRPCHNTDEVVAARGYDPVADRRFTSSSIFFTKGKGFTVPGSEVEDFLHGL